VKLAAKNAKKLLAKYAKKREARKRGKSEARLMKHEIAVFQTNSKFKSSKFQTKAAHELLEFSRKTNVHVWAIALIYTDSREFFLLFLSSKTLPPRHQGTKDFFSFFFFSTMTND
jgi:hypothetical protein